jgi:hypothetical protein
LEGRTVFFDAGSERIGLNSEVMLTMLESIVKVRVNSLSVQAFMFFEFRGV